MIKEFLIDENKFVKDAILKLESNGRGTLFVVNKNKVIKGIITDGDLRRFFLKSTNLNVSIKSVLNRKFISINIKERKDKILETISKYKKKVKYIPIINNNKQVIDYASPSRLNMIPIYEPFLKGNESKYLNECIEQNWISSAGTFVKDLENKFSKIYNHKNILLCSSGTASLHIALLALGIKKNDEVIIPDITFAAVINTVLHVGAKPVIVDVDKETWNIDFDLIKKKISKKTKAIIVVHLFGNVCDVKKLKKIVKNSNIKIIEDCAEAIGSKIKGKSVGLEGDISTFSFYGNKAITTGEGGMIILKNKEDFKKATLFRDNGMSKSKRYWHEVIGLNYKMTNLQAAIGLGQVEKLSSIIKKKIQIAKYYRNNLKKFKNIKFQKITSNSVCSYWAVGILFNSNKIDLKNFINKLKSSGIETRRFFYPLSIQPPYKKYKSRKNVNSNFLSQYGLTLPSFVDLKNNELKYIVKTIKDIIS